MRRAVVSVVGAAAVVGLVVGVGGRLGADPDHPVTSAAQVVGKRVVCPGAAASAGLVTTMVAAKTGVDLTGTLTTEPAASQAGATALDAGAVARAVTPDTTVAQIVSATGPLAAGLTVTQIGRGDEGDTRGYAVLRCEAPRTDASFVGVDVAAGSTSILVLVNAEDVPADVDVTAIGASGPTPGPLRGRVIAPHSLQTVALDTIAPGEATAVVRVHATRGTVASAVSEVRSDGTTPKGNDSIPSMGAPQPVVYVPGILGRPDMFSNGLLRSTTVTRTLVVGNPGETDTTVQVQLTDDGNSFVPVGLDAVPVPAGTVVSIPLDPSTASPTPLVTGGDLLARVTSNDMTPVNAGVVMEGAPQSGDIRETFHLGAADPLVGSFVVPEARTSAMVDTVVSLTAVKAPVTIVEQTTGGKSRTLTIAADRTTTISLSGDGAPDGSSVTFTQSGDGVLYGAVGVVELGARGPLFGGYTLAGAGQQLTVPAVRRDGGLGLVDARGTDPDAG